MKSQIRSILFAAAALFLGQSALHANIFTYNNGDVLLVFRQPGQPNLEVNLGPVSQFINASPGSQITITNFDSTQLQAAYSSVAALNWAVISDVRGAPVYSLPVNTLFLTNPRTNATTQTTPYNEGSTFAQASVGSVISSIAGYSSTVGAIVWSSGTPANAISNTLNVVIIPESDSSSYTSIAGSAGGLGGNFNQGDIENLTPNPFTNGVTRSDLYELEPGSSPGTYLGYFEFDPDGAVSFTAAGGGSGPDLTVSIPSDGSVGSNITYTVAITNNGPATATNVVVTDTLPGGVNFLSAVPTFGTTTQSAGVVTWNLDVLSNGASASVVIEVSALSTGEFTDAVTLVYPANPVSSNNTATATVTNGSPVIEFPDLSIVKVTAPKKITLTAKKPTVTKSATVEIANVGTNTYTITSLSNLVTLAAESLTAGVPNAEVTLVSGRPQKPLPVTLKKKGKLSVVFDVTFNETTNSEFNYVAQLNDTVVSNALVSVIVKPPKQ
jgi:uncharacterized repeat protein (TIGR01451 family)